MDRCPECKGFLVFEDIIAEPVWTRWTSCTRCGRFTSHSDDGMVTTGMATPKPRIATHIAKVEYDDDSRATDRQGPDSLHGVPEVQPKRVGGPIGRY